MTNLKEEIRFLLLKLDEDDLYSLARTVTQGLKKSNTKEEAIQHIIKYSQDEISILRRKLVTREILFSYLDDRNIKVHLPTTKNELIDRILEHWNIPRLSYSAIEPVIKEDFEQDECKNEDDKEQIRIMAEQFTQWFYSMLNSNDFGSEHLFPDAKLKLNLYMNDTCDTTVIENDPEDIKNTLLQTRLKHNLYFNVNTSKDGVQGRMDPHGLVLVLVCGTVHVQDTCAGVFEQVFALARDPSCENNWKIKNTELNLRSKSKVIGPPKLCDSELTSNLLMLPSE